MPIYLFNTDISQYVQRDTIRCTSTLNIQQAGNAGQTTLNFIMILDSTNPIKPRTGNQIIFIGDDGLNRRYFGGIIVDIKFHIVGFNEQGKNVYQYDIICRDLSFLLDKNYISPSGPLKDTTFISRGTTDNQEMLFDSLRSHQSDFVNTTVIFGSLPSDIIGNSYAELMGNVARLADSRIVAASNNDVNINIPFSSDMQVRRMTLKQFLDHLSQESGLVWWIDEYFQIHIKSLYNLYNSNADSYFNITEASKNYYNLSFSEEFTDMASQVIVTGQVYDVGAINVKNAIDGIQRQEEISITITDSNAQNNVTNRLHQGNTANTPDFGTSSDPLTKLVLDNWRKSMPELYKTIVNFRKSQYAINQRPSYGNDILTASIEAPLRLFESGNEAIQYLQEVGKTYLRYKSIPKLTGTINYLDKAPYVGQVITVNLNEIGIATYLIVTEVEIDSSGETSGNNELGQRKYTYKVSLGDISYANRFARIFKNSRYGLIKRERKIKPSTPELYNYTYSQDNAQPVLLLGINIPHKNNITDSLGQPQPLAPAVFIKSFEVRVTGNELARSNPTNKEIFWVHQTISAELEINVEWGTLSGFEQYNFQQGNGWSIANNIGARINNIPDKDEVFFQVRSITAAGEASDWSHVRSVKKGESKDENDQQDDPAPGSMDDVSGEMDAGSAGAGDPCCPRVPVGGAPPSPHGGNLKSKPIDFYIVTYKSNYKNVPETLSVTLPNGSLYPYSLKIVTNASSAKNDFLKNNGFLDSKVVIPNLSSTIYKVSDGASGPPSLDKTSFFKLSNFNSTSQEAQISFDKTICPTCTPTLKKSGSYQDIFGALTLYFSTDFTSQYVNEKFAGTQYYFSTGQTLGTLYVYKGQFTVYYT